MYNLEHTDASYTAHNHRETHRGSWFKMVHADRWFILMARNDPQWLMVAHNDSIANQKHVYIIWTNRTIGANKHLGGIDWCWKLETALQTERLNFTYALFTVRNLMFHIDQLSIYLKPVSRHQQISHFSMTTAETWYIWDLGHREGFENWWIGGEQCLNYSHDIAEINK